jgi:hypothetical protein
MCNCQPSWWAARGALPTPPAPARPPRAPHASHYFSIVHGVWRGTRRRGGGRRPGPPPPPPAGGAGGVVGPPPARFFKLCVVDTCPSLAVRPTSAKEEVCVFEKAEPHTFDQLTSPKDAQRLKAYLSTDWKRCVVGVGLKEGGEGGREVEPQL